MKAALVVIATLLVIIGGLCGMLIGSASTHRDYAEKMDRLEQKVDKYEGSLIRTHSSISQSLRIQKREADLNDALRSLAPGSTFTEKNPRMGPIIDAVLYVLANADIEALQAGKVEFTKNGRRDEIYKLVVSPDFRQTTSPESLDQ